MTIINSDALKIRPHFPQFSVHSLMDTDIFSQLSDSKTILTLNPHQSSFRYEKSFYDPAGLFVKPFHLWNTALRVDEVRTFIYFTKRRFYILFPLKKWSESPLPPVYAQTRVIYPHASPAETHTTTNIQKRYILRLIVSCVFTCTALRYSLKWDARVVL